MKNNNRTQNNPNIKEKKINRRTFCGCMAVAGAAATGLVACGDDMTDNFTSAVLSADQVNQLKTDKFLNIDGAIIAYNSNTDKYFAFTRLCPHEGGNVEAESATAFRCHRHTRQIFNFNGSSAPGNGAVWKSQASLNQYSVAENADGTLLISKG